MFRYDANGTRVNPSVQIATSMTQVFKQGLSLPEGDPQFDDEKPHKIFEDMDPMETNYDPLEIEREKEYQELLEKQSKVAADNINPVKPE